VVLLAYKERDAEAEATFFDALRLRGFRRVRIAVETEASAAGVGGSRMTSASGAPSVLFAIWRAQQAACTEDDDSDADDYPDLLA
jgi:hypothetical protein